MNLGQEGGKGDREIRPVEQVDGRRVERLLKLVARRGLENVRSHGDSRWREMSDGYVESALSGMGTVTAVCSGRLNVYSRGEAQCSRVVCLTISHKVSST